MRRAKASISSVVVRPLPHSRAMRRKGALVMAAMGASRHSSGISIALIFIGEAGPGPSLTTIHRPSRSSDRKLLDTVDPIRIEGEIALDLRHAREGCLVRPHRVLAHAIPAPDCPVGGVALEGAVGVMRGARQRAHRDVLR